MFSYLARLSDAEFLEPMMFWLSLPAGITMAFLFFRKRLALLPSIIRLLSLLFFIVALADPIERDQKTDQELAALLDVSFSVSEEAQVSLLEALQRYARANTNAFVRVYPFGRKLAQESFVITGEDQTSSLARNIKQARELVDTGDTNIAAALTGFLSKSGVASVFLLSDGFETSGVARDAAKAISEKGIRVFPLIPENSVFSDSHVTISALDAPITTNAGDISEIRASVRNPLDVTQTGVLELWLDQTKLYSQPLRVPPNEEKLITVQTPAMEGGLKRIRARLIPGGAGEATKEPAEKHRWISVKSKSKILLLSGAKDDQRVIRELLGLSGFTVEDIVADGTTALPKSFDDYSTVIINNAHRRQLSDGFLDRLKTYTNAGGGVLLIGGERSFGLGNYIDTPLEEISPLKFVPPQTTKRRLTAAVILVIDKSRSMIFQGKIEGAKAAAASVIGAMKEDDFVGVIGFDANPFIIIRLSPVPEVKAIAEQRLRNLTPSGKTNLLPALAAARQSLQQNNSSRKHIIILSDGEVPNAGPDYVEEIRRLERGGVSVSAVAVGFDADVPFMKMLSTYGRGAFYQTLDPRRLPEIFVQDVKVSTGDRTLKEQSDFPIRIGPSLISTSVDRYPPLRGFVETVLKKEASLELLTVREDKNFPILASWNYGNGRVAAFTSDANGRWSQGWLRWDSFPQFWKQVISSVKNRSTTKASEVNFDLRYTVESRNVVLDLSMFDDKLRLQAPPKISAVVTEPGGETKQVFFDAVKKGRFQAAIENGRPGDYRLEISYGTTKLPPLAITVGGESFGETPGRGLSIQTLSDIAHLTAGAINPDPTKVSGSKRITENVTHLFLPLLIVGFILIIVEAFIRELGIGSVLKLFARASRKQELKKHRTRGSYGPLPRTRM